MKKLYLKISKNLLSIIFIGCLLIPNISSSQILKTIKGIKDVVRGGNEVVRSVNTTTKEVVKTINTIKEVPENIKYKQNPDIRNRSEINIDKNQKLKIEKGEFKNITWNPITYFNNQVFPSFIIGWASYNGIKEKDMGSSLGFSIQSNMSNISFKWEIECSNKDYFNLESGYVNYPNSREILKFMPKIAWDYKALTKHLTSAPLTITFRLIDPNNNKKTEKKTTISLKSINDCVRFFEYQDLRYMYATYVNEDHPEIPNILSEALKTRMVNQFDGYQGNEKTVDIQVAAIWRVLNERGFKYSNITDNSGVNDDDARKFSSQSIRTFDNAIKTNQANCVDGTVVFASILKKIGIRPLIITVPGHCFLGYYTSDEENSKIACLETTMLSSSDFINNPKKYTTEYKKLIDKNLPKGNKLDEKNKAFYLEFLNAKIIRYCNL